MWCVCSVVSVVCVCGVCTCVRERERVDDATPNPSYAVLSTVLHCNMYTKACTEH